MQEHPSHQAPANWIDQGIGENLQALDSGFSESETPLAFAAQLDSRCLSLPAADLATFDSLLPPPVPGRTRWLETVAERETPGTTARSTGIFSCLPAKLSSTEASSGEQSSENFAESLDSLVHDARNLVTALDLYCDLLATPDEVDQPSHPYTDELRLIANGSRRLLEKLGARCGRENGNSQGSGLFLHPGSRDLARLDVPRPITPVPENSVPGISASANPSPANPALGNPVPCNPAPENTAPESIDARRLYRERALTPRAAPADRAASQDSQGVSAFERISATVESVAQVARWRPFVASPPIQNLAEEVLNTHNLLCALAGPGITVGLSLYDAKRPVSLSSDDLTRILVNLVKNASDAMPEGGHIHVALEEFPDHLSLSVSDTGIGIAESALEAIFTAGYTSKVALAGEDTSRGGWPDPHHGMGLAIVRSIMAAAGGSVTVANRRDGPVALLRQTGEGSLRDHLALPVSGAVFRLRFPIHD